VAAKIFGGTTDLPMEVEGEAAGVRAAAAHVDCCVLCVLCCGASCLLATNNTLPTLQKVNIGSAKMANFCTLMDKNTSPNHPNIKAMPKSSWCEDFGIALTFLYGKV
jgi:hypothetical protein